MPEDAASRKGKNIQGTWKSKQQKQDQSTESRKKKSECGNHTLTPYLELSQIRWRLSARKILSRAHFKLKNVLDNTSSRAYLATKEQDFRTEQTGKRLGCAGTTTLSKHVPALHHASSSPALYHFLVFGAKQLPSKRFLHPSPTQAVLSVCETWFLSTFWWLIYKDTFEGTLISPYCFCLLSGWQVKLFGRRWKLETAKFRCCLPSGSFGWSCLKIEYQILAVKFTETFFMVGVRTGWASLGWNPDGENTVDHTLRLFCWYILHLLAVDATTVAGLGTSPFHSLCVVANQVWTTILIIFQKHPKKFKFLPLH
jgi:hypothetical protein